MRVLLVLSFDGTGFCGWQMQPGLPTVQQTVEEALEALCGRAVRITAAGRTDSGVHAACMPAHLDLQENELERVTNGLNSLLPGSIRLRTVRRVPPDFSARFNALSRTYRYRIGREPDPFTRLYEYQPEEPVLDTTAMKKAAELSPGEGSWKGFAKEGSGNSSWIMKVAGASVEEDPGGWNLVITANRFLRGVVRIWSGTLYSIGNGRLPPETVRTILDTGNRDLAGPSLPAEGLTLVNVEYDHEI